MTGAEKNSLVSRTARWENRAPAKSIGGIRSIGPTINVGPTKKYHSSIAAIHSGCPGLALRRASFLQTG
ncbi:MAG TPA: hypothetical protein DEA96_08460 [Leptospiraceae bacterium]|nr:hypothetical protein [Spirochaetaceae bacterium]HBS04982.1 hypothetical protein [Leptospiraceae bacterium]